ncbi:GNAT family N-acetyltransferase [Pseudoalteromonas luteoviolacea]|uniref:GNAT family N-acetyltransferase n=1 Tax=Pseudoalteromonas luteoviolacea TaxID=43657 RepID=UPI0011502547|nr:GNAT family protein [Pseudoalteromonas luteoviolacea]TQF67725.1 GNAT family N-acetyltransferase [Pseudoalteromonas luteoviolacea]
MRFETARLIVRPLQKCDLADVYQSRKNPDTSKYIGDPATIEDARQRIEEATQPWQGVDHQKLMLAIRCKTTDLFIGELLFKFTQKHCHIGEIGYRLSPQHLGKGYAFEATSTFVPHLFDQFELNKVIAVCAINNVSSWRLMEKLGMRREGELRDNMYLQGNYHNSFLYSILRRELQ